MYKKGSLALKVGYALRKCSQLLAAQAIKSNDKVILDKVSRFEQLYSANWYDRISACAAQSVGRAQMNKLLLLPTISDVEMVNRLLEKDCKSDSYPTLAKATLALITIFNRKRGGEVQRMKVNDFKLKPKMSRVDSEILQGLTETEKKLAAILQRVEIRGKFNRPVPILLTPVMIESIQKLLQMRTSMKLDSPYLFITPNGSNPYRGSDTIRQYAEAAEIGVCYRNEECAPYGRCEGKKCKCQAGFLEDGRHCTDINECENGSATCPDKAKCINSPGSYQCVCLDGYAYKNKQCVPYHKTCDEMFKATPGMVSGRYTLDFDGEGPLPTVEAQCVVKKTFAITEVTPSPSFPQPIPGQGGKTPVTYPVDLKPLVNNSDFCTQEVWLKCTKDYNGGPVQWQDASGTTYTGFGGSGTPQKCACGEVGMCPGGCHCGRGQEGEDGGLILLQGALPLSKVILPKSTGGGTPGTYYVGKVRCGPKSFDLPKDCQDAKFNHDIRKNTPLYIDMDGAGPRAPMLVYCNQEDFTHVGIVEIPPDKLVVKQTTSAGEPLRYTLPGPDIKELIEGSAFCSQRVEYQCQTETRSAAGVQVTTRGGLMTYFPGGNSDKPGSCACGVTQSCDSPTVQCNCDIGDARTRSDLGLVIDKAQLPVLKVRSTASNNTFTLGPLQCSQKQFDIQPNCEKLRQDDVTQSYSYRIDPDGPAGSLKPFTVQCVMDDNQGVTVVNNKGGDDLDLSEGRVYSIGYLQASPEQLEGLKFRSTVCVQQILFSSCPASQDTINIASFTYNNGRQLSEQLAEACPGAICPCDKNLTVSQKDQLPVAKVVGSKGTKGTLSVGSLKCKEIHPDCEQYNTFVKKEGVEGEKRVLKGDTLTIDPDGPKDGKAFVVHCRKKVTIIGKPDPSEKPVLRVVPSSKNPGEVCWQLNYTDARGAGIGAPQMAALVETANKCAQTFKLTCSNALGTGMVRYKTCTGKSFSSFVSGQVEATCACGATGTCAGGPDQGCNCDTSGQVKTTDLSWIISNTRLPVCEVCMKLENITGSGAGVPDSRSIKFEVSDLICGKKQGRKGNCQLYRQEKTYANSKAEQLKEIWMDTSNKPILVGCRFKPNPPIGEMVIRPKKPDYVPGTDFKEGNITIIYRGFPITAFKDVTSKANYCTQDIFFFCAADIPDLTGSYGIYSHDKRLQSSDYELRDLSAKKINELCKDQGFTALCTKCGRSPKRLMVTNKGMLPVTKVLLPKDSAAHLGVDGAACTYVEKDCEAIRKAGKVRSYVLSDGYYVIDPDQQGPLPPFKVRCDFVDGDKGVTRVPADPKWVTGENSDFCWQGVKYECQSAPLASSALVGFNNQSLTSFGTGDKSDATGCVCSVLGTCKAKGVTCNCDSKGSMVDQGTVTDKDLLPITGFKANYKPNGKGSLTVTDVRCAPAPVDPPRDCAEAFQRRQKYGVDYSKPGEYLISPDPAKVRPFHVYCDYSIDPANPVTVVKPEPKQEVPVGEENPDVPYQGPSNEQLRALVQVSAYCYQPVKIDCYSASFIKAGVRFLTVDGTQRAFWSSGTGDGAMCTCGSENVCGGTESKTKQALTNCNCDIGDKVYRSDAAILDVKKGGPLRTLVTKGRFTLATGQLNLTVGDVFCAQKPIEFNECATGFDDCAERAQCIDEAKGYRCVCPPGWRGRVVGSAVADLPMANGRECIDDDECSMSKCPYSSVCHNTPGSYYCVCKPGSVCHNTPGSYYCVCKPGYRQVDNYTCEDIDECKKPSTHNCDTNARCINTDGSYVCRCLSGFRGSGQVGKCYAVAQCMCFGDPHCESFDGKWSHFQGRCTYVMAGSGPDCRSNSTGSSSSSTQSQTPEFLVATRNWDHNYVGTGEYAWVKEVIVKVYGKTIVLGQGVDVRVDGVQKDVYRLMSTDGSTQLLSITNKNSDIVVYTEMGLEVIWDGDNEVTVFAPTNYRAKTCGLCGNFNRNPDDDWMVGPACPRLAGQTTTREPLFGNSWTYSVGTCSVNCDPPEPVSTCDMSVSLVRQQCRQLFADPGFAKCLKTMPANDLVGFNKSCEYDMCHSDNIRRVLCQTGRTISRYCAEKLTEQITWREDDMCKEKTCATTGCGDNMQCVKGSCVCKMGYTADCQKCVDVDECDQGEHNCTHLGQKCVNRPGTYQCDCLPGFQKNGQLCKNINECNDPKTKCPDHAECHDFPGGFKCDCCMGYVMKGKDCIRDAKLDVYGAPGKECCACTGAPCKDPQPICGTDGKNYPNYRAMVVKSCTDKTHVEVNYPGPCKDTCEPSPCIKPHQTCEVKDGVAMCKCPDCGGGGSPKKSDAVCASNKQVYPSQCQFQLTMCETDRSDVTQESSMEPCDKDKDEPVGPWSEWGECSNKCGKGTSRRTREKLGDTTYPLVQEKACYTECDQGPCQKDTCTNPGQVCQQDAATGKEECVCPDCAGQPDTAVCGLVGLVVRTYDNACLLKQKACEQIKNYTVVEDRACEDKPDKCGAVRNFVSGKNKDGCVLMTGRDVGRCYGGCGHAPGQCCSPVKRTPPEIVTLVYLCADKSRQIEKVEKVAACQCVDVPKP
ncbi:hypothetical protein ACOMHN_001056 [Nucella lapillus]